MKILVLNSGSSSLKFKLYEMSGKRVLAQGLIERIGEEGSAVHINYDGHHSDQEIPIPDHDRALGILAETLPKLGILESFHALGGVGHRVVHGGEAFTEPVLIDEKVRETIRRLIPLAPLHNPANLRGIEAVSRLAPELPQVAVFDTAFHQSMAPEAYCYAVPESWYREYHVRRYGFHGTSHYYVSRQLARLMEMPLKNINAITLHLGNGASACAVQGGRSIETSMGLTPLEGLVMGTRSGDIDPGIHLYMNKYGKLSPEEIDRQLNHESGLLGIAGVNDMREIQARMEQGDERAKLAFEIFVHRLVKYVGAYAALLGRLDALVFTGGIGEHSAPVRRALCERLEILGIRLDPEANERTGDEAHAIHDTQSRVALWVIPTDEEGVIAEESYRLIGKE
ncbi:acetate/propionate family kinase [Nitratifractor salsuginis]|uniref:Acetate kinase n=1 Tax=Nitratifractor salsuginis (strain DSM 16511 / JCM 12458 / E9I37-1) TaxID=749222 RepID=E6X290_NITSE|nr:acetate kinase [Nitratifractor salsuginis]ADV46025.1 acetate kinase [Nitratifractor salsuginis DSM 16511]